MTDVRMTSSGMKQSEQSGSQYGNTMEKSQNGLPHAVAGSIPPPSFTTV